MTRTSSRMAFSTKYFPCFFIFILVCIHRDGNALPSAHQPSEHHHHHHHQQQRSPPPPPPAPPSPPLPHDAERRPSSNSLEDGTTSPTPSPSPPPVEDDLLRLLGSKDSPTKPVVAPPREFHHLLPSEDLPHYFDTDVRENVPEYVIISPRHIRGSRRRRDLTSSKDKVEYHVTAFGEDYWLDLHHNDRLIGQGCVLQHRLKGNHIILPCTKDNDKGTDVGDDDDDDYNDDKYDDDDDDCYYTGVSRHHTNSTVAVSLCSGLNGVISAPSNDHDLVIQPIKSKHLSRAVTGGHQRDNAHIVYKRRKTGSTRHGSDTLDDFDDFAPSLQSESFPKGIELNNRTTGTHRTKRNANNVGELYMELLLVADASMYQAHGTDLKNYLLTITNVAAARFLDSSLGDHRIHLRVVKMIILETDVRGLEVVEEAGFTLKSFCQWQEQDNPAEDSNPGHYDAAALITKLDLTHGSNGQSTTGLATRSGMCGQYTRCSVSQDTGVDTGLTVAHEIGHSLGMAHDSSGNSCPNHRNIMSSHGARGVEGFRWSSCSKDALDHFLGTDRADCLKDQPSHFESLPKGLPGVLYSGDQQCELWLGKGSTMYEDPANTDPCGNLMCTDVTNPARAIKSSMPVMEGTMCGQRKYCIKGTCQDIGPNGPRPVDGGWSAWPAMWSVCSRTCNGGVRTKTRLCTNPRPRLGGKDCVGEKTKTELCNIQACVDPEHKFKENQCRATSDQSAGSSTYDWLPFDVKGAQECHLMCISRPNNRIQRRVLNGSRDYQDGTSCLGDQRMDFYRCVQGVCEAISCDGHSDSDFRFDRCGICGGRGDSCDKRHGSKTSGQSQTWTTIAKLPKGSTGVRLTNKNRFAKMTLSVNGKPLFNTRAGGSDPTSTYSGSGVTVKYGQGTRDADEMLEVTGPLPVDVDAEVFTLYDDSRFQPDISYEFYIPTAAPQTHQWRTRDGACTVTCGGGVRILEPSCHRRSDGVAVEDRYCDIYSKPHENGGACNTQPCSTRWKANEWSACSKTCGGGVQTRSLQCVQAVNGRDTSVDEGRCQANRKPSTHRDCNIVACGARWISSDWSSCSMTCGKGTQTREVKCVSGGQEVATSNCRGTKPESRQTCVLAVCDTSLNGDACGDVLDACSQYDVNTCKDYGDWAKTNCMETCSFCSKGEVTTVASSTSCEDTSSSCPSYGVGVCTDYRDWAGENCAKYCNLCGSSSSKTTTTTTATTTTTTTTTKPLSSSSSSFCVDTLPSCEAYDPTVCTQFKEWATTNCAKFCGVCGGGSSKHLATKPITATTTTTPSSVSSRACVDKSSDCSGYGQDICVGEYKEWASLNCAKFCNSCGAAKTSSSAVTSSCQDKLDCAPYGGSVCADYVDWSMENCAKMCGLCGSRRRKRSAYDFNRTPVCGHVVTSSSGSVDVIGRLDRDVCSQMIVAPLGHVINITLDAMLVDCDGGETLLFKDLLEDSSVLDLCRDVDAVTWLSRSNNVEVILTAEDHDHGYKLTYHDVPGLSPVPDCSRQLTDPSGPLNLAAVYQDRQLRHTQGAARHCETVITAPEGMKIQILMSEMNKEELGELQVLDVLDGVLHPMTLRVGEEWTSDGHLVKLVSILHDHRPQELTHRGHQHYKGRYTFVIPCIQS